MDRPSDTADERIDELESRLALQDQSILELGDEIYRQQRQIAQLDKMVRDLTERLRAASSLEPANDPEHEIPPHY